MKIIKMKRILILIFAICFTGALKAQQLPQITQYMNNNYVINPAVSGMYDYYQVNTTMRNQWAGMNEGPRTSVISKSSLFCVISLIDVVVESQAAWHSARVE